MNADYWSPIGSKKPSGQVLLYCKADNLKLIEGSREALMRKGYHTKSIVYGEYKQDDYLTLLRQSEFAVFQPI